ncbi:MAG: hypothetical protein P8J87_14010, partial [Verrucomicrobiales bacterium]|nr:hypothetical protein [Verrucomicrobiales bacterium]
MQPAQNRLRRPPLNRQIDLRNSLSDPLQSTPPASTGPTTGGGSKPEKKENALVSLLLNVVLPGLILNFLSNPDRLGPLNALFVAISLPVGYGIYDAYTRRKLNFFS